MSTPKKKPIEQYSKTMSILKKYLPLDDANEMKLIDEKFKKLFKNMPPNYEEKRVICQVDKEFIKKLGGQIIERNKLTGQITEEQLYRSISKNITLFKYVVISMEDSQYANDIKHFADKFVKTKTASKPLPIPQINTVKKSDASTTETSNSKKKDINEEPACSDVKTKDKCMSSKVKLETDNIAEKAGNEEKSTNHARETDQLRFDEIDDEDGSFLYDPDNPLEYIYYFAP